MIWKQRTFVRVTPAFSYNGLIEVKGKWNNREDATTQHCSQYQGDNESVVPDNNEIVVREGEQRTA